MNHIQQQPIHCILEKPVKVWQTERGLVSGCQMMRARLDGQQFFLEVAQGVRSCCVLLDKRDQCLLILKSLTLADSMDGLEGFCSLEKQLLMRQRQQRSLLWNGRVSCGWNCKEIFLPTRHTRGPFLDNVKIVLCVPVLKAHLLKQFQSHRKVAIIIEFKKILVTQISQRSAFDHTLSFSLHIFQFFFLDCQGKLKTWYSFASKYLCADFPKNHKSSLTVTNIGQLMLI